MHQSDVDPPPYDLHYAEKYNEAMGLNNEPRPHQPTNNQQHQTNENTVYGPSRSFSSFQMEPEAPTLKPKDHLVFSIISLIFLNLIAGIIALVFSVKTRRAWRRQRYQDAREYSKMSFIFNIIAVVLGLMFYIFLIIYFSWRLSDDSSNRKDPPMYIVYDGY
jgi:hypothetical protein